MSLYDYQLKCIEAMIISLAKNEHPLGCAPGGSGKSLMIAHIVSRLYDDGKSVTIIAPSGTICIQNRDELLKIRPHLKCETGVCCDSAREANGKKVKREYNRRITFATSGSLLSKKSPNIFGTDVLIIDEAHIGITSSSKQIKKLISVSKKYCGFTATGYTLSSSDHMIEPLFGEGKYFDTLAFDLKPSEILKSDGSRAVVELKPVKATAALDQSDLKTGVKAEFILSEYEGNMIDMTSNVILDTITSLELISAWEPYTRGKPQFIVYGCSVEHTRHLQHAFEDAGISTARASGKDDDEISHHQAVIDYKLGEIQGLILCDKLTVGFNAPNTALVVFARPTRSRSLWQQSILRAARSAEGKLFGYYLDVGGNSDVFGTPNMSTTQAIEHHAALAAKKEKERFEASQRKKDVENISGRENAKLRSQSKFRPPFVIEGGAFAYPIISLDARINTSRNGNEQVTVFYTLSGTKEVIRSYFQPERNFNASINAWEFLENFGVKPDWLKRLDNVSFARLVNGIHPVEQQKFVITLTAQKFSNDGHRYPRQADKFVSSSYGLDKTLEPDHANV